MNIPPIPPLAVLCLLAGPASADIVHRYSFGGTGTAVVDSVGNADGVVLGGATLDGSGRLTLDGDNDYVDLPNGILDGLTDATFEAWVKWNGTAAGPWQRVFDFGTSTSGENGQGAGTTYIILMVEHVVTEHVYVAISAGSGEEGAHSPTGMPIGQMVHMALTFVDGDRLSVYINGEFKASAAITIPLSAINDNNNWLGRSQYIGNSNFWGQLDEFRMYGHAMNDAQVAISFANGPNVVEPGSSYCFGDGSGTACPCANAGGGGEGCANSSGSGGVLSGAGSGSVSADDLAFTATQLLPSQPALLFSADNRIGGGDGVPFGDGLRCAGGNVKRLGIDSPNGAGNASWGPGLHPLGGWQAGDTRRFQVWYRDPSGSPCGNDFNLTNGYEVVFTP